MTDEIKLPERYWCTDLQRWVYPGEVVKLPEPDTASLAYSGRSVDYINGYEAGYEVAADQVRTAVLEERTKILDALHSEINHCACNDLRMMPAFGRVKGDPGIPATYIDAVIERFGGGK